MGSECFYFDIETSNSSRTKVTVGYGDVESFVHSLEADNANSTELQAGFPDDNEEPVVVGVDLWDDDAQRTVSVCTADDCVFDPSAFVQNDGVLNLEIWADEAESDEEVDAEDGDVETAWVAGVARRTGRRVVRRTTRRVVRPVVPFVPVVPGVRGVARRTTRRVVRRTTRRVVRR